MTPTPEQYRATAERLKARTAQRKAAGLIPEKYDIAPRPAASPSRALSPRETPQNPLNYPRPLPCISLGEKVDPNCACVERTCNGGKGVVRHLAECQSCDAYSAFAPIATRHLLYHVYPRRGGQWRRAVLAMRERIGLFNGRKVVAIAHDRTTESPVMVEDALSGCGCEFVHVANTPQLREVATFEALFGRLADDTDPGSVTLYAHAKGATRPEESTAGRWGDTLAELYLDYPDHVADVLSRYPVAGAFLKVGKGWAESKSTWHYSGSWFWARNAELFKAKWRTIDRFWSGIEPYPSLHFPLAHAGCLFHRGTVPSLDLYSAEYWGQVIEPALAKFRAEHPKPAAPSFGRSLLPPSAFSSIFAPLRGKTVGYLPTPGNAGDHLIEAATFQLFAHFGVRWTVGTDAAADLLLISGGGSMGAECYGACREVRERAKESGKPVWVLPQSWHAPEGGYSRAVARDAVSAGIGGAELMPDLALGLSVGDFPAPTRGKGVWLRKDIEAKFADRDSLGDPVSAVAHSENPGWAYLELAAEFEELVTDRLHFAICGLLAKRKVTLLPNSYHKNRACWEAWLQGLGCLWADSPEDA